MLWGCFPAKSTDNLTAITGKWTGPSTVKVLDGNLFPSARTLKRGCEWIYQFDKHSKHIAKATKGWLKKKHIKVMEWPNKSPDLNPICGGN